MQVCIPTCRHGGMEGMEGVYAHVWHVGTEGMEVQNMEVQKAWKYTRHGSTEGMETCRRV